MRLLFLIFITIVLFTNCNDQSINNKKCECDLLSQKEDFFIKEGEIIKTNTSKKRTQEESLFLTNFEVGVAPEKINLLDLKANIKIPFVGKDEYYYQFNLNRNNDNFDKNLVLYFLSYCSLYPLYHKSENNCSPTSNWKNEIDNLTEIYLQPNIISPDPITKTIEKNKKKKITISGRVVRYSDTERGIKNVEIYFKNEIIGKTDSSGNFYLEIDKTLEMNTIQLVFKSQKCGTNELTVNKKLDHSINNAIILKCT